MSVTPSPIGGFAAQFFDNNGVILSGGKIYTYSAGTTTPQATYTSALGITPHANPIILDSAGRVPGGEIWLTDGLVYKFVIETSTGILIGTYDNITGVNSNFVNYTIQEEVITATAGQTVFNLSTINYTPGTNSLSVFIDGVNQYVGDSYLETDSDTVTFTAGVHVGGEVKFTTAVPVTTGAIDASTVGYTANFTGATGQTVQTKLEQYVSVKDFGAVGDGVTDDTAAIQAAITYAFALIGTPRFTTRTIYFPSGEYLVTQNNWLGAAMPTLGLSSLIGYTMLGDGRKNTLIRFKPSVSGAYIYDQTVAGVPALLAFETNGIGFVFDQANNGGGEIHGFRVQGVSGQASQLIKFARGINYVPTTTRWLDYVGSANEDNTIIEDFHFPNGLQTLIRSTDSESLGHYVRNVYVGSLSGHLFEMTRGGNLIYDGGNVTTNSSYVGEVSILKTGYGTLTPGETQQDFAIKNVRVELRSATSRALYVDRQAYAQIIFDKCNFAGGSYQNQALAIIPVQSQAKIVFRSCIWPQQSAISATAGKVQMVDGRLQTDYSSNNAAISEVIFEYINFASTRNPAYTSYSLVDWTALTVAAIYRTVSVVYRSCDTIPDSVEYGYERKTGRTFRYGFIANIPFRGETFPIGDGTSAPVNTASDFNIVVPLNNFVAGVEINRRAIGGWGAVLNYAIRVVDKTEYDAPGTGTVYGSTTPQGGGLAINQTIYINKTFTGSLDSRTLYLQIASGYGVSGAGGAGTVVDGGALLRLS